MVTVPPKPTYSATSALAKPSAPENLSRKKARPETTASWREWAQRTGVSQLSESHPDRRRQLVAWGAWYRKQPIIEGIAIDDPVRQGPPKGWSGVI